MSRFRRYAAALCVGASLIGVSGYVLRADVPRVSSGTWATAGEVGVPSGAGSVALTDGRVVVVGGERDGVRSSAISIYDPASSVWARAGDLVTPRSGHTVTLLNDGRVLVAGGSTPDGPTFDIEIFDPANGTSVHAGDMTLPRVNHAAAILKDGRVLIVGGSDGSSALDGAEVFDPVAGQSAGVPVAMSTARVKATATTMLDGHVLVVGGSDGANDLASAEIFDPATSSFFATGPMQAARSGHVAVLLPHNNQVLIAGGMSAGAAVASAELYADWRDGFTPTPTPMSAARSGGIAVGLQPYDVAMIAGGGAASGEYFGYATVKTDKDDYAPYETVTISGSGWQPGETVRLRVSEDADTHYDWTLEATADASGNIVNREFYPRNDDIYKHIGMRFYLTAVGSGSQALATFTDAMQTQTTLSSSLNPSTVGQSVTFTAVVEMNDKQGNQDNWKPAVGGSVKFYDRTTATDACDKNNGNYGVLLGSVDVNAGQATFPWVFQSAGTYPILACYRGTGGNGGAGTQDSISTAIQQKVNSGGKIDQAAVTVSAPAGATYQQAGLSAVASGGSGTGAYSYSHGASTACTVNSTTGALTITSGTGTCAITATRAGDATYNPSSPSAPTSVTINKALASVTVNNKSKIYGGANPALDATVTGTVNNDVLNYSLATTALATSGVGSYPITVTLASNPNYTITTTDGTLTIGKATAAVKANNKSRIYGTTNPTFDAVVTGTVNNDVLDYSLASAATQASGVGSYPIVVTLGTNPNYNVTKTDGALTIDKATATVAANAKSRTYGAPNPTFDATVTGTVNNDVLDYSVASAATQASGVGSYPIVVTLGTNPNYNVTKTDGTLTIDKAAATVTANAKSRTYGAANPTFDATVTGTVNNDVLDYSLASVAAQTSGVGSYPIVVTLGTNPNYNVTKTDGALTIDKAAATVTANAKSRTYGAANPTFDATVTGTVNNDVLDYSLASVAAQTSDVGSYPIVVTLGTNPNYNVTKTDGTLTIDKAAATVTANAKSKTYGQPNPAFDAAVTGTVNNDVLDYSLASAATQASGVGSYPIVVTLGTNPNYNVTKTDGALTIDKAAATVTANAKSKTYGQANPAFDATVTGTVNNDVLDYSLASAATQASGVGSYPIVVTLGTNPNYNVTKTDGALTIDKAAATVTANAKSKTYGQANPAFDATVTGTVNNDVLDYSLASAATQASGVGSYPIVVTLGTNPNYNVTKTDGALTIDKAAATVTANAKSKTYGQANPAFDATVTGTVNNDVLDYSLASAATQASGVGSYPIVVTLGTNPNYNVTKTDGTLTIDKAAATVTANAKSRTYGAANPTFDATVTGAVNNDVLDYSLASVAAQTSGVGSYPIVVTLGTNPNYNVTKTDGTLTIDKAAATVTANAKSRTYGAANPTFDATVTGAVNNDVLDYSLASVAAQTSGVGSYPIVVTLGTNPNYNVTKTDGTLTIDKAAATVTANAKSRTYGAANPTFDATVTGAVNNDVLDYSLASVAAQTSGVGSYPIVVTLGTNPNYHVTKTDSALTIGKATATVTANAKSRTYGAANPTFDATVTGTVNNDVLDYSLASVATQTSGVGSYPIVVTVGTNPNYDVTKADGSLTIGKAPATVTANAKSRTYGAANPTFDATVTGTVNNDVLDYSVASAATQASGVGSYPIVVTLGTNPNYDVTPHEGKLTIGKATASVTANDKSKTYGQANPAFDAAVTGRVNNDVLDYSLVSVATQASAVGSYPIVVTLGTNPNYTIMTTDGTLAITKATASVTAKDTIRKYGVANPTFEAAVTGAVNNDVLNFSLTTAATQTSGVGTYPIVVNLGTNANYQVTSLDGTLTIGKATASVKANDKSRTYGDANPALDAVVTGAVNDDVLQFSLATAADKTSSVGAYPIVVTLGTNLNYEVSNPNGTLTVTKAPLAIKANDASRPYGMANPAFTGSYSGQKNGETFTMSFTTTADITSPVGPYDIVPSANGATIANYEYIPTRIKGTLTVGAWSLKGFYEPVGEMSSIVSAPGAVQPAVSGATVWNAIKGGQTVPMKFNIYRTAGGAQVTTVVDAFAGAGFTAYQLPNCSGGYTVDEIPLTDLSTGATELRYDGTQFIQNWKTPKVPGADLCYRAVITAKDGSTLTAFFKLKK